MNKYKDKQKDENNNNLLIFNKYWKLANVTSK